MSGGSYDYLYCVVDSGDSLEYLLEKLETLEGMCNRLKEMPNAESARQESMAVLHEVKDYIRLREEIKDSILTRTQNLADVWQAVEYYDSCDCGIEDVERAILDFEVDISMNY